MKPILFDFSSSTVAEKTKAKIVQLFERAGKTVASADMDDRTYSTTGFQYRKLSLVFSDSQTVTMMVKVTGDVYQILIDGKVFPLRQQDDPAKAIAEICSALDKGSAAFQKKLLRAKTKIEKTSARSLSTRVMRERQLTASVAEKRQLVESGRAELQGLRDQIAALA